MSEQGETGFPLPSPNEARFLFRRDSAYRMSPVSGAFGGVTPSRQILAEFYVEYQQAPDEIVHQLSPIGTLGEELSRYPNPAGPTYIREALLGVMMPADVAESIANWLLEKVREARNQEQE